MVSPCRGKGALCSVVSHEASLLLVNSAPFFPGNMWTATCDYVRKLSPPLKFEAQMSEVRKQALLLPNRESNSSGFTFGMFSPSDTCWGTGRFSYEQWISSHPDIRPCDLSENGNAYAWVLPGHRNQTQSWSLAPRYSIDSVKFRPLNRPLRLAVLNDRFLRATNYYLLAGQLFRWSLLYNQVPSPSSWAWNWFPDGWWWRRLYEKLGSGSIQAALQGIQKIPEEALSSVAPR
jgi:hypothetical protein